MSTSRLTLLTAAAVGLDADRTWDAVNEARR